MNKEHFDAIYAGETCINVMRTVIFDTQEFLNGKIVNKGHVVLHSNMAAPSSLASGLSGLSGLTPSAPRGDKEKVGAIGGHTGGETSGASGKVCTRSTDKMEQEKEKKRPKVGSLLTEYLDAD